MKMLFCLSCFLLVYLSPVKAQVPVAELYPDWGLVEYVESATSAQYLLRQQAKPQEVFLFMKQETDRLTFSIKKGERKNLAQGHMGRDDSGEWEIDFIFLSPGLSRPLLYLMDRSNKTGSTLQLRPFQLGVQDSSCKTLCTDAFLASVKQTEVDMGLEKARKAIRNLGYDSEEFARYEQEVIKLMTEYLICRASCD